MKIKVEPLLPTGNYLNVRVGVELEVPDDGDMKSEINTLWDNILAIHMERYPHLYTKEGKPLYEGYKGEGDECRGTQIKNVEEPIKKEPKRSAEDEMVSSILSCKELKVLESYRLIARNNPIFQEAYNLKLKELQP